MATLDPSLVAHLPLFSGFGVDELGEILREARSLRFAKNSAVFEQGEDAHSFFRAFHDWEGSPPGEWRARHAEPAQPVAPAV